MILLNQINLNINILVLLVFMNFIYFQYFDYYFRLIIKIIMMIKLYLMSMAIGNHLYLCFSFEKG